jgi:hypothetical protein
MGKKDAKAKKEETPESLPEDLVITPDELLFQRTRTPACALNWIFSFSLFNG